MLMLRIVYKNTFFENRLNDWRELHERLEQYYKEDLQMFKSKQLYIPQYGRARYAYNVVFNNYLSERFI